MTDVISAPQPKTFAPSKEDVLSTLAYFFGAPVSPEKLKNYEEHHAQTYHFPDAYYGQNTKIADTLNNLILKSPQNWQTSVGLPFFKIEGTVVEWDEIRFDVRLMQRVPYEGVSRMQTSLRRFYATEAGRQHFSDQLTSIQYCVQETCNFDVLFSYLTCGNYDFRYDKAKSLRPRRSVKLAMQHEVSMYAIAQKEGNGLDKAVEEAKYRMSRYGVTPTMMCIPPQLALYMTLAPEEKTLYAVGGPKAQAEFDAGLQGFATRAFRGLGVVMSEPFEVSDDADSVQMLTRSTQVGEFYVLSPPVDPITAVGSKGFMDVMIYDEESDRLKRITWEAAYAACLIGELTDKTKIYGDADWDTKAKAWAAANADPTETKIKAAITAGICHIVVARPFIEHLMHSAVIAVAGRDTGATLFGPADMQISANTQVKTIEGHYTGHFKSVVTKPQNVFVLRDISCAGYVAGGNCDFFTLKSDGTQKTAAEAAKAIMERLSFAEDTSARYPSMLAFPMSETQYQDGSMDTVMSITNRLLPWEVNISGGGDHKSFPGGEEMYAQYSQKLQLRQVHYGEDMRAQENMEYISQGSVNNALCFLGPHRKFNPYSKSAMELVPGQGHWGPDAIPGDARWRRGESVSLKSAREAMVSLEVAASSMLAFGAAK